MGDIVFDEEIILFIDQLPFEFNWNMETYNNIELEQDELAILLHCSGETFKIGNGKFLEVMSDIVSGENLVDLKIEVIWNNKFLVLQTIVDQEINVILDTAIDNSYLMLINDLCQRIRLENIKIELR